MKTYTCIIFLLAALPSLAAEEKSSTAPGKHLFILTGQSNMREPLISTFASTVKKALGEDQVIIASHSVPSQPIRSWYRNWLPPEGVTKPEGGTPVYDSLMDRVKKSIHEQKIKSVTLVWMQGEADAQAGWGSRYEESFIGLLEQFKTDLGIQKMNFVLGRINDYWLPNRQIVDGELIRALQVKMAEFREEGAWINTDDLNTGVNPWNTYEIDGGHFPNSGYRVMGQRFAREACKLAAPEAKLDETLFTETFVDEPSKLKLNLALKKKISGATPDPKYSGGELGLASLTDGMVGKPDHTDSAWLAFPPTETNIEFLIDLEKSTDLSSIAINILTDHRVAAHFPEKIDISVSENNTDFSPYINSRGKVVSFDKHARQHNLSKDLKPHASIVFIDQPAKAVRYLKFKISQDTANSSRVFIDEIIISPAAQ